MDSNYQIDDLDRKILRELRKDARVPFVEIAEKLIVSGGTIHQRVNKMKLAGLLKGFQPVLDETKLGLSVTSLIGIHLKNAKDCNAVIDKLIKLPEVIEAHYTTGTYALMIKVVTATIQDLHTFLMDRLQGVSEIQSTESFICLSKPIDRPVKI